MILAFQLDTEEGVQSHSLRSWAPSMTTRDKLVQILPYESEFLRRP